MCVGYIHVCVFVCICVFVWGIYMYVHLCMFMCVGYIHVCTFVCICVCVWGIYMYVHSCVCVCMCVRVYVECFSLLLSNLFLQDKVSHWTHSSPFRLDYLVSKTSGSPHLCIPSAGWRYTCTVMTSFYVGALDPNAGLHVYMASTLSTKLSPQPCPFVLTWLSCHFHLCTNGSSLEELFYWQLYKTLFMPPHHPQHKSHCTVTTFTFIEVTLHIWLFYTISPMINMAERPNDKYYWKA